MARCNCPGSSCSCLIQAGDGIRVSGIGTVADPYIVELDPAEVHADGTPVAAPVVTGSRGGNTALASLLSVLAAQGLITNNTTA